MIACLRGQKPAIPVRGLRAAILANDRASFVRPIAEGLHRILADCGADSRIHYDGLHKLGIPTSIDWSSPRSTASTSLRLLRHRREFDEFVDNIRNSDVVIVVAHVPASFSRVGLANIELLRELLPAMPIVNYDLVYLPTVDKWGRAILNAEDTGLTGADMSGLERGNFGMDRYDWYLAVRRRASYRCRPARSPAR